MSGMHDGHQFNRKELRHGRQQQMLEFSKQLHTMQELTSSNSTTPGGGSQLQQGPVGQQAHSDQVRLPHQCASILQLLASKDQPLLVRGDACRHQW